MLWNSSKTEMNIPFNTWIFSVPMIVVGIFVAVFSRDTAKRMADMTGYSQKEKAITVSASTSPHLFALLTVFIPPSSNISAFVIGALLYATGLIGFVIAVLSYSKTPPETPAAHGIYKISRNPMYVTALIAYTGITVMTLNIALAVLLVIMILLHRLMIKAEEKACLKRFGKQYEQYMENTPRYIFL